MYNGYTKRIPLLEQIGNEIKACKLHLQTNPHNRYYLKRLAALQTQYAAELNGVTAEIVTNEDLQASAEPATVTEATEAAYGALDLLSQVPNNPNEMYQAGWVMNSRRAAIKQAYENNLHKEWRQERS